MQTQKTKELVPVETEEQLDDSQRRAIARLCMLLHSTHGLVEVPTAPADDEFVIVLDHKADLILIRHAFLTLLVFGTRQRDAFVTAFRWLDSLNSRKFTDRPEKVALWIDRGALVTNHKPLLDALEAAFPESILTTISPE